MTGRQVSIDGDIVGSGWTTLTWLSILGMVGGITIIFLAGRLISWIRHQSRTETVFQSAARHEGLFEVTQQNHEGPHTESLHGSLEIRRSLSRTENSTNSADQWSMHNFDEKEAAVKHKLSWRPSTGGSSGSTLVGDEQFKGETEQREGLIELKRTGSTRNFFDPQTGETLHLSPWKSRGETEGDGKEAEDLIRGDTRHALVRVGVGSAILTAGSAISKVLCDDAKAGSQATTTDGGHTSGCCYQWVCFCRGCIERICHPLYVQVQLSYLFLQLTFNRSCFQRLPYYSTGEASATIAMTFALGFTSACQEVGSAPGYWSPGADLAFPCLPSSLFGSPLTRFRTPSTVQVTAPLNRPSASSSS